MPLLYDLDGLGSDTRRVAGRLAHIKTALRNHPADPAQGVPERNVSSTLLLATSATALLVAGLVIMNIMLLSVSARVQEIGLRRASGARRGDILAQFLTETLLVTLTGGAAGLIVGVVASLLLSDLVKISWVPILIAVVACAAMAILFGMYPARKAAAVDPIVALRNV